MKGKKRDIFSELMGGVDAMKKHRTGKITLRTHKPEALTLPEVTGGLIRDVRARLGLSQGLFAEMLHVNPRTLANWEQNRSKPNEQAAALILMVQKFPDTLIRLRKLAA
jgi:putative transcriptional regulator